MHPHPDVRLVDGIASFLHRDHLASVTVITDDAGATVTTRDYTPHGDMEGHEWVDPLSQPESKAWIGERFDPETGLVYLHARYYDPKLGLFTQGDWWDPAEPGVGTNRYMYAFGDPVNLSDSNGHAVDPTAEGPTARGDADPTLGEEDVTKPSDSKRNFDEVFELASETHRGIEVPFEPVSPLGYDYSDAVIQKAIEDPKGHGFPTTYDTEIWEGAGPAGGFTGFLEPGNFFDIHADLPVVGGPGVYEQRAVEGTLNGIPGRYEIGVEHPWDIFGVSERVPTITHRAFRADRAAPDPE